MQAFHGDFGVLEELLYKYQVYIDVKDEKGRTPLDLAAYQGHQEREEKDKGKRTYSKV